MDWREKYLNKITCGDCLELMKDLPDNSIDLVVTDPPYGVGKAEWDSEFPIEWILEATRISKKMLVMTGNKWLIKAGNAFGPLYKDLIILRQTNSMTRSPIAFSKFIPILVIGDWKFVGQPNIISYTVVPNDDIDHPCPKPLGPMKQLINWYAEKTDLILDPFLGSGTTAIAAYQLERDFIGFEINPDYCAIAQKRLDAVRNQGDLFRKQAQ